MNPLKARLIFVLCLSLPYYFFPELPLCFSTYPHLCILDTPLEVMQPPETFSMTASLQLFDLNWTHTVPYVHDDSLILHTICFGMKMGFLSGKKIEVSESNLLLSAA